MADTVAAMRALFAHLDVPAAVVELSEGRSDLHVIAVNEASCAQFGRPAEDLVGQHGSALYPPAALSGVLAQAWSAVEEQRTVSYEAVRELATGRSTVTATVVPVAGRQVVIFGRDISEEREASRQLAVVERSASIGSWTWNITDDALTWSAEYRRILGVSDTMRPDQGYLMSVMHPDDRDRVRAGMDRVAGGGPPSKGVRFRIRRPDGETRTVEGRGEVAQDDSGRAVRMTGTIQDVTDQVEAEQRERRLEDTERRRRQALEVNDDIVQGLAAAGLALQLGHDEEAGAIVARTTEAAQVLVSNLLHQTVSGGFDPGTLVRGPAPGDEQVSA